MMAVLPIVLYPLMGLGVAQFAAVAVEKPSVIGIWAGAEPTEMFPPREPASAAISPVPVAAWFATASQPGLGPLLGTTALVQASRDRFDYPPFITDGHIHSSYLAGPRGGEVKFQLLLLDTLDRGPLDEKQVDVILSASPDFWPLLLRDGQPALNIQSREKDERSQQARRRLHGALEKWSQHLKEVRFQRHGLPAHYDSPIDVKDPEKNKTSLAAAADDFFELLVRIFPFVLVMWSLAGALYPAVDICAGEKERGTMETLLISPASRQEIVFGKFLTIWVFSAATALLNLASMGAMTALLSSWLPHAILRPAALVWCALLVLPLSAFFSALCLAVGAYARSSKEGQHYLMPLFLLTMPLIFLTLAPGVELSPLYSLVPVTGVALLLQRLMAAATLDQVPWFYFLPVLAPMVLYSWVALRWAIDQFQREEVLFREAERLDLGLWVRHLFRAKEPLPSAGQAFFCFGVIVVLQWVSLGFGDQLPLTVHAAIRLLAFIAAPAVLMAVLLTTRPRHGLMLRLPGPKAWPLAALLAVLLVPPLAELTYRVLHLFPNLKETLVQAYPLVDSLGQVSEPSVATRLRYFLALAFLPTVCEEVAFRGFILSGLRARFRPWAAILLSSFLFALARMDVFQFLPSFVLGMVLGILAVRTGSVLPGMVFHLLHNTLLLSPALFAGVIGPDVDLAQWPNVRLGLAVFGGLMAVPILWRLASRMWIVEQPVPEGPLPEPEPPPLSDEPAATADIESPAAPR